MIGLVLALFVFMFCLIFSKGWPDCFIKASRFLFYWSVCKLVIIFAGMSLANLAGGIIGTILSGSWLVGWLSHFVVGNLAFAILFTLIILSVLQIIGAHILSTSVVPVEVENNRYRWDWLRLIFGLLLYFIGSGGILG